MMDFLTTKIGSNRAETEIVPQSDDAQMLDKLIMTGPGTGQNTLLDLTRSRQAILGYGTATFAAPDVDRARDPYRAREIARSSAESWKRQLARATPPDVTETMVINQWGGTGSIAQAASPIPLAVTGHDVMNATIGSHKARGVPTADEAINQVLGYQTMDKKMGHLLFANDVLTFGKEGTYDRFADFLATFGLFDMGQYRNAPAWTGAMETIDAGEKIDPLREEIRDVIMYLHDEPGPWWATDDYVWWEDVESPLRSREHSSVLVVYPQRFEDVMTDVEARDLPHVDQAEYAPVDFARIIVLRRMTADFVRETLQQGSKQWLINEIKEDDSVYGQTWRDLVDRHRPPADPVVALEDLIKDLQRRR